MLILSSEDPFARGGNRLCFIHPTEENLCVKVRRPDISLKQRRKKKGFPKNLRPLYKFDDNLEEFQVMNSFKRFYGSEVFHHVSRCFGFEETDLGKGLVSELIKDSDGRISQTLKKYIWDFGLDANIKIVLDEFTKFWLAYGVPSRDLLLHNIVVQIRGDRPVRLVVIDGLGSPGLVPAFWLPTHYRLTRAKRKIDNLQQRINTLLDSRGADNFPGYHGLLLHDGKNDNQ